ncbi:zinc-dependent alcohol dehydrogenase family protein [Streptomyces sp900129855]|uniref:Zinc-dependent alcohol dehydrogenase family protein n=1 Tax=Streptomyces sp. 900129855 TaxID=3155129 RepID=A0ABV2ZVZ4_9ACTN
MKIVRVDKPGPPSALELVEVPIPEPGPGEVLVRAHSIGVGYPDLRIRAGTYPWMPPLPAIPGTELSGVVERIGEGVTLVRPGQLALLSARERTHRGGHYAEYVAAPQEATFLLPEGMNLEQAAALANYQVAYHMIYDSMRPLPGQVALVYGAAGGIGNAVIDLLKGLGVRVLGVASNSERARWATRFGADEVIDRTNGNIVGQVAALTDERGVDWVVTPAAGPTIPGNIELLAPAGTLVIYSTMGGAAKNDLWEVLWPSRSAAVRLFNIHTWDDLVEERRAGMRALIAMLAEGRIRPHIHRRFKLSQAREAHELLEQGEVTGKILLQP